MVRFHPDAPEPPFTFVLGLFIILTATFVVVSAFRMYEDDGIEEEYKESWWQQGVTLFAEVSSWIVAPVVLALVFGKILDNHFQTKPWIFLSLTVVSFFVSCYGIFRIVQRYIKEVQQKEEEDRAGNEEEK